MVTAVIIAVVSSDAPGLQVPPRLYSSEEIAASVGSVNPAIDRKISAFSASLVTEPTHALNQTI
jgi:hypothetical protein